MPDTFSTRFLNTAHGDLTISWEASNNEQVVVAIQALMDKGITFHILSEEGKTRKRPVATPITATSEITNYRLLIKDADIRHIVEGGIATLARFEGTGEIKTVGRAKTAAEAAATDTVAVQPKQGG